jgi:hypothetical protein
MAFFKENFGCFQENSKIQASEYLILITNNNFSFFQTKMDRDFKWKSPVKW